MKLVRILLMLLAAAAIVAGCGDDEESASNDPADTAVEDTETFSEEDFDITFQYPDDFETLEDVQFSQSAGAAAAATTGVGLDGTNLIAVQRFDLETEVTDQNFDEIKQEADRVFSQAAGEQVSGQETDVAGLPALEYEVTVDEAEDLETRAISIFDGNTQYLLNCQSGAEQREAILAACDLALETFEPQ